jgi:predicted PurR-regulated permease PerM
MDDNTLKLWLSVLSAFVVLLTPVVGYFGKRIITKLDTMDTKVNKVQEQTNGLHTALIEVNRSDADQQGETRGRRQERALGAERIAGILSTIPGAAPAAPPQAIPFKE